MKTYFLERCTGGAKNVNFWKIVKPFFSKKCNSWDQNIILYEDNKIINDTCEVSEKFKTFSSTVTDKIGEDIAYDPATHPSIVEIKNHVDVEKNVEFQHITSDKIEKIIDKLNIKKASGFDNIPAKVIKQCKPIVSNQLTSLINLSIDTGVFPDSLKKA
jgi:hypothetical protein